MSSGFEKTYDPMSWIIIHENPTTLSSTWIHDLELSDKPDSFYHGNY